MNVSGETKFFAGVVIITIAILIGAIVLFSKPTPEVALEKLVPSDAWATGSATPKVTLVEFSDFECPACGAAYPYVKKVIEQYKDELRFVHRHFPLDQHKFAERAAEVSEAAGAQGKFWEMHDLLFENQASMSAEMMNGLAIELKLDIDAFNKALADGTYKDKVQKDQSDGIALGINSTPTFFLNGKKLSLFNFSQLQTEVEKAINTK